MDLLHEAEGLPAEYASKAPVTLVGAAHIWASRAKTAEAQLRPLRRRLLLYRLTLAALLPPAVVAVVLMWARG